MVDVSENVERDEDVTAAATFNHGQQDVSRIKETNHTFGQKEVMVRSLGFAGHDRGENTHQAQLLLKCG